MPKPYATYSSDMFKMSTSYEWTIRSLDSHGDSIECYFADSYREALKEAGCHECATISLVRNRGNEAEGLDDRQEAEVGETSLPEEFDGGTRVPKRFHAEVARG